MKNMGVAQVRWEILSKHTSNMMKSPNQITENLE